MIDNQANAGEQTKGADYTVRLESKTSAAWRRLIDPQLPYAWNVRRLCPGRVLDVGCGIGRNLRNLRGGGVGVDHNPSSVAAARAAGFIAFEPQEFHSTHFAQPAAFDSILAAHLLEHVGQDVGDAILAEYLPYLRPGGRVVLICPQERGYSADATHIRWLDWSDMVGHLKRLGVQPLTRSSFPLPRAAGKLFTYNETVVVGELPTVATA